MSTARYQKSRVTVYVYRKSTVLYGKKPTYTSYILDEFAVNQKIENHQNYS